MSQSYISPNIEKPHRTGRSASLLQKNVSRTKPASTSRPPLSESTIKILIGRVERGDAAAVRVLAEYERATKTDVGLEAAKERAKSTAPHKPTGPLLGRMKAASIGPENPSAAIPPARAGAARSLPLPPPPSSSLPPRVTAASLTGRTQTRIGAPVVSKRVAPRLPAVRASAFSTLAGRHEAERIEKDKKKESADDALDEVMETKTEVFYCHECKVIRECAHPDCARKAHRQEKRPALRMYWLCPQGHRHSTIGAERPAMACRRCDAGPEAWMRVSLGDYKAGAKAMTGNQFTAAVLCS